MVLLATTVLMKEWSAQDLVTVLKPLEERERLLKIEEDG